MFKHYQLSTVMVDNNTLSQEGIIIKAINKTKQKSNFMYNLDKNSQSMFIYHCVFECVYIMCVYIFIYVGVCECIYIYIYIYFYVCMCINMFVCVCV